MLNKAVDNYPHVLEFVPECFMTKKMCDKAVNTYPSANIFFLNALWLKKCVIKQLINAFFVFDSIPNQYITQGMCDRVTSENAFLIVYCPDKYITQRMCDEAVDDSLAALKLIPSKMIKECFTALYADENILYFNEDSRNFCILL